MKKRRNYNLILGLALTCAMVGLIVMGWLWTPFDPNAMDPACRLQSPSLTHLLGTDNFGRDIFSRVLQGAGATFLIGVAVVLIGGICGVLIGGFCGYYGGWLDDMLMRSADIITAFPSILLALVIISLIGAGKYRIILALGVLFIPSFSRLVRGEVARCKSQEYVANARLMGAKDLRVLFVHILPNTFPVLLSSLAIGFNNAVLAEASMSYLGIGVQPPDPSLGRMLSEAQTYFFSAPWYALSAGCAIVLLILGVGLIADGLGGRRRRDRA